MLYDIANLEMTNFPFFAPASIFLADFEISGAFGAALR
jgi:hypothetical protein